MRKIAFSGTFTLILTILSVIVITAQSTCSLLVEQALTEIDTNCSGIARNEACYGFDLVRAEFQSTVAEDFFTHPADIASIIDLETIATTPLDEVNGTWGVAVMNVQANLPDTLPGQNVTFVLLGDTEVENAVEPNQVVTANTIQVISSNFVTVRSGPGENFNALAGYAQGSTFTANGLSQDGRWVRILLERAQEGWVQLSRLQPDNAISTLSAQEDMTETPMQAVYLRTGIGQPTCQDAPDDILLVQGPEDFQIELTVNGANFRIGSTVAMRLLSEDLMEVYVIDGKVEVLDDDMNPTGIVIETGQRSTACLSEPENRGLDGEDNDRIVACEFSLPEWVDSIELGADWCILQDVPSSLLSYPIDIFCPGDMLPTPVPPPTATPLPPPPVVVINPPVQPNPPEVVVTVEATDEVEQPIADCSTFRLLGPFSGITPRNHTFSWTSVPTATDYEIVFYNYMGGVAQTFFTQETSITLNVGQIPTGHELQYETRAYSNGAYLCVTSRTGVITRLPDPNPSVDDGRPSGFAAGVSSCVTDVGNNVTTVVVFWRGEADDARVIASGKSSGGLSASATGIGAAGTLTLAVDDYFGMTEIEVVTSSGNFASLPDCT